MCLYIRATGSADGYSTNSNGFTPFSVARAHQQLVVLDDTEQLGPLPEAFLAQQEGADARVLHQMHGRLLGRPLVARLAAALLLLVIGLVGAAHGVRVVV